MSPLQVSPAKLNYVADVSDAIEPFLQRWALLADGSASPFHSVAWLRSWYATLGNSDHRRPLFLSVKRNDTGADVMMAALTCQRVAGLSIVEFMDARVVDYVSPLLANDWAGDATANVDESASRLWQAIKKSMRQHDVLRINKMLGQSLCENANRPNPLAMALPMHDCEMFGSQFEMSAGWDAWRNSLDSRVRREFDRSWRVFTRSEVARFERVQDPQRALELFAQLEAQQSQRIQQLGKAYFLSAQTYQKFHHRVLLEGLAEGSTLFTALLDGEAPVALQFGIANKTRYIALRQSVGGDAWKNCSPGRLLHERTAHHLHEQGVTRYDFGIGDYAYKKTFNLDNIPLYDTCVPLSWRGQPIVWAWKMRRTLKRQPWLMRIWRHLKPSTKVTA